MEQHHSREAKDLPGEDKPGPSEISPGRASGPGPAPLAEWRLAEERLYPMVMVIPESYERVVRLVGATTVELQLTCPDLAALVAESSRVADRVRRLAAERGIAEDLDFALIGSAACLMRYRQIEAETHREQRIRLIATAVAADQRWVVLVQGVAPTSWPPLPSTTLEMHLASGRALEMTIAVDESSGAPRFGLAEVALVPATGERGPAEVTEQAFSDLHEWRAAIADRRREIELGH
jgi:hypothetical protein